MHKRIIKILTDEELADAIKSTVGSYDEMIKTGRTAWGTLASDTDNIKVLQSLIALHYEQARRRRGVDGVQRDNGDECHG